MFGLCAQVPEHINDKYFARVKAEAKAKKEGDIFEAKKEEYKPSEERKKDQVEVDKQVFIVPGHIIPPVGVDQDPGIRCLFDPESGSRIPKPRPIFLKAK
jgi:hypothetical protein